MAQRLHLAVRVSVTDRGQVFGLDRSAIIRIALAALTGAAAASMVLGLLVVVNAGDGFARCTATTGAGWLVPLVAVAAIAGAARVLLSGPRPSHPANAHQRIVACPRCAGEVRGDWRLCPHCGERLEQPAGPSTCPAE